MLFVFALICVYRRLAAVPEDLSMKNQPDATKLLAIARATLLDKLLPQLTEASRYDALMIANAMAIAIREYAAGDTAARAELARLQVMFAENAESPASEELNVMLATYNRRLAREIRSGRFDDSERAALLAHLAQTTADELAVANPRALQS